MINLNFPMTKQVIIIGAGPGGLSSAILLAAAGVRVKILERLPIVGGRTSSIEADGFKFDLAHTLDQMLHLRPHNRFEDLDGMYLVGGGTHPGSGLPVIFESARISSRLLLEDLGVDTNSPLLRSNQPDGSGATAAEKPSLFSTAAQMLGIKSKPTA